jgi:hypothetical protein
MSEHKSNAPTKRDQLLVLFSDKNWHSHEELAQVGGIRYSARILELKRLGHDVESKGHPKEGKEYRCISRREPPIKRVKVFLDESDVLDILDNTFMPKQARKSLEEALASFEANRDKL